MVSGQTPPATTICFNEDFKRARLPRSELIRPLRRLIHLQTEVGDKDGDEEATRLSSGWGDSRAALGLTSSEARWNLFSVRTVFWMIEKHL